jgi:hypothetical protein
VQVSVMLLLLSTQPLVLTVEVTHVLPSVLY